MMAAVPPSSAHRPEAPDAAAASATADGASDKKEGADPLSFLASITERVLGNSSKRDSAEPPSAPKRGSKPGAAPSAPAAASSSKKGRKSKKTSKFKKTNKGKKRIRGKEEDDDIEERNVSPRLEGANRPPVAHVVIINNNNNDNDSLQQEADATLTSNLQDEYKEHFMATQAALAAGQLPLQQPTTQAQLQQQLLMRERMMMMENATFGRLPESFLSRQYAALEQEELELAALRRRREQLLLNMNSREREELLMRNAAATGNFSHHAFLGGLGGGGISNTNQLDLAAVAAAGGPSPAAASTFSHPLEHLSSSATASTAFGPNNFSGTSMRNAMAAAAASMGYPSARLMGGMSNSPLLRALSAQNTFSSFPNPAMAVAAATGLGGLSEPAMAMSAAMGVPGAPPTLTGKTGATEEVDAKRLAPARGVFNKNIKSNDDVIDSLARANARFYKNDTKKAAQQRFRGYQCEQWTQKYQDLLDFKAEHGNW